MKHRHAGKYCIAKSIDFRIIYYPPGISNLKTDGVKENFSTLYSESSKNVAASVLPKYIKYTFGWMMFVLLKGLEKGESKRIIILEVAGTSSNLGPALKIAPFQT